MSNTIQHYYMKDLSPYLKDTQLNIRIDELNNRQAQADKGAFHAVSKDDAATIEISELARAMYGASVNASDKQDHTAAADTPAKETEETIPEENIDDSYEASVAREQKELEDYIANHPADTSIDLLRNGSLAQQAKAATNIAEEPLIAAEKEYMEAFAVAAGSFADFSMKITYGDYSGNDVSVNDLNFDAIDQMEDIYQHYKEKIQSGYDGDERAKYLDKLDAAYNSVFEDKIINTVKGAYDDKLTFFRPDSEETFQSIRAASASKESLNEMFSSYMASQAVNKTQYTALSDGTKNFYDMAGDKSLWHNTAKIKGVLTDSMNVYSSVKEIRTNNPAYISAKLAADEIAKKVSDKYAEQLEYQSEKMGFKKDGEDTEWSSIPASAFTNTSSGMFMIDFRKIMELHEYR